MCLQSIQISLRVKATATSYNVPHHCELSAGAMAHAVGEAIRLLASDLGLALVNFIKIKVACIIKHPACIIVQLCMLRCTKCCNLIGPYACIISGSGIMIYKYMYINITACVNISFHNVTQTSDDRSPVLTGHVLCAKR